MNQQLTDVELLEKFTTDGDHRAFEEIYERYFGVMFCHAQKMLKDTELACDLVQDIFVHILLGKADLSSAKSIKGYLYSMTRNKILNHFIREKVEQRYQSFQRYVLQQRQETIDGILIAKELQQTIEEEVRNLPPKMREAFELSRETDLTYKEIAQRTGSTEETIRKHIYIAMKRLRSRLSSIPFFFFW